METLNIQIVRGHSVPRADAHVVIDVIRAFTVAHCAFQQGADRILLCQTTEEAVLLKQKHPTYLLMGEVDGLPPAGFDFGNSPYEISCQNLQGTRLIHRTTHGTQVAVAASHSPAVAVSGFSNARATAQWLRRFVSDRAVASVCLVASHPDSDDDFACAQYIEALVRGGDHPPIEDYARRILESRSATVTRKKRGIDPRDLDYCVQNLIPEYVMKMSYSGGPVLRKEML